MSGYSPTGRVAAEEIGAAEPDATKGRLQPMGTQDRIEHLERIVRALVGRYAPHSPVCGEGCVCSDLVRDARQALGEAVPPKWEPPRLCHSKGPEYARGLNVGRKRRCTLEKAHDGQCSDEQVAWGEPLPV